MHAGSKGCMDIAGWCIPRLQAILTSNFSSGIYQSMPRISESRTHNFEAAGLLALSVADYVATCILERSPL